jgi:hypothetical protein
MHTNAMTLNKFAKDCLFLIYQGDEKKEYMTGVIVYYPQQNSVFRKEQFMKRKFPP